MKRKNTLVLLASLIFLTTGCASTGDVAPSQAPWTPPAWFAEQAREREQARASMQACVEAKGWAVTANEWGGAEEPFDDQATSDQFLKDSQACQAEIGIGPTSVEPDERYWRESYQRALDTWACLRNEGINLASPPSESTYVEQRMAAAPDYVWTPYSDPEILRLLESNEMTSEERAELEIKCPQSWA